MLVDVLRKIWAGLLMDKIRKEMDKWGMINENQSGFMTGRATHTAKKTLGGFSLFFTKQAVWYVKSIFGRKKRSITW
jgi:hypothetical protein